MIPNFQFPYMANPLSFQKLLSTNIAKLRFFGIDDALLAIPTMELSTSGVPLSHVIDLTDSGIAGAQYHQVGLLSPPAVANTQLKDAYSTVTVPPKGKRFCAVSARINLTSGATAGFTSLQFAQLLPASTWELLSCSYPANTNITVVRDFSNPVIGAPDQYIQLVTTNLDLSGIYATVDGFVV